MEAKPCKKHEDVRKYEIETRDVYNWFGHGREGVQCKMCLVDISTGLVRPRMQAGTCDGCSLQDEGKGFKQCSECETIKQRFGHHMKILVHKKKPFVPSKSAARK